MYKLTNSREKENQLVTRCIAVAKAESSASNLEDASVFLVAAKLIRGISSLGASRLEVSAKTYFLNSKEMPLDCKAMIRSGLIVELSRFRNLLEFAFRKK